MVASYPITLDEKMPTSEIDPREVFSRMQKSGGASVNISIHQSRVQEAAESVDELKNRHKYRSVPVLFLDATIALGILLGEGNERAEQILEQVIRASSSDDE